MEEHLPRQEASRPDRHSSAFWEPCYISALYYTRDLSCDSHSRPSRYPLIPHLEISQEWRIICSCIGVSSWVFDGPNLWPALWTSRICGVGHVLLLLYLLLSVMCCLHSGPLKFAWIAMSFTLWEVSALAVFSGFLILPYRMVVKCLDRCSLVVECHLLTTQSSNLVI